MCCCSQFKYEKTFITNDIEQNLVITRTELTACCEIPKSCSTEATNPFTDFHVQIWLFEATSPPAWVLLHGSLGISSGADYDCRIDALSGDIKIVTHNNQGTYRVVVLA